MLIILDNGHGKDTPGKCSPVWPNGQQLHEHEFNRWIVRNLDMLLRQNGYNTRVLVPENFDVSLTERVRRVNELAAKQPCILISIHANAGGGTGWEVFTSPGETNSDKLAKHFYKMAVKLLPNFKTRVDFTDGDPDKEAAFTILTKTVCPAVLTENLFMDTQLDCEYIISFAGRMNIVRLHYEAIKDYLEEVKA